MAKAPNEPNLPTTTPSAALPSFLAAAAADDAGKGVSNAAEDNIVPLVYLLQANSPQCNPRGPEHVENGISGNIWLRGSGLPAIDGEAGLLVQPCFFSKTWIEWRLPRGSGLAGVHANKPDDAYEAPDPEKPERTIWLRKSNGNQLVETRNHVVRVHISPDNIMPFVVPLSGSGHTVSRNWMMLMGAKKIGTGQAPSWASMYRLTTKLKTKGADTWNIFQVEDAGWVQSQADYESGKALHEAFAKGEKQADIDQPHEDAPQGDDAAM